MNTPQPLVISLLALLGACGRRPSQPPPAAPLVQSVTVPVDAPAVVDAPALDDHPPPAPDAPSPDAPSPEGSDAALLRGLADGSVGLAAHLDPAHGVVFVTYLEASPSGRAPVRRSSRRLCGAAAARDAALRARLREAVAQAAEGDGLTCGDDECVVPGMEYQPAYRLRLGRAPDGTRVLLGAMQMSEAALGEEWLERVRVYVDQAMAAARARPCPR
ncbi:MAG: hypothetical protein Q8S73_29260 [Deltaproteobacteria bacterium]|nr:hypothetical protein [Myxococcales bacterium]MDP3218231.1 hypothetical protein [Deltaproteobacteria bacterium]